jgi:hypothetical protein
LVTLQNRQQKRIKSAMLVNREKLIFGKRAHVAPTKHPHAQADRTQVDASKNTEISIETQLAKSDSEMRLRLVIF